jgi:hypothetical protein
MRRLLRGRPDAPVTPSAAAGSAQSDILFDVVAVGLKALAGTAAMHAPRTLPDLTATDFGSRPPRFEETISGWFAYWSAALDSAPRPHRKLWEFAAVLQAMFDRGLLTPGARALGAGVGDEPVASALAKLGLEVTATDLPDVLTADRVRRPNLLSQEAFEARVRLQPWNVLAPAAPEAEGGYDIVWSCGLLSQFGDVDQALTAINHSLARLRPGGWAFHTLDFAFEAGAADSGDRLARQSIARLAQAGAGGLAPSFDLGDHPLDGYIDPPPFDASGPFATPALFSDRGGAPHLKALIGGRAVTSYLLILRA